MWWLNKIKHVKVLEQPDAKWSLDKCHYHLLPVIESTLEKASQSKLRSSYKEIRPVNCKEFRPVHPEGNQPRIFIGRTVAEAEAPNPLLNSLEKTHMLGKIEGKRRRGWQKMWWSDGTTDPMDIRLNKLQEMVKDREALRAAVHRMAKSCTWHSDWTRNLIDNLNGTIHWELQGPLLTSCKEYTYFT